jgi:hypothetical protein
MIIDELLTPRDVAGIVHMSPRTLEAWRSEGYGPKFLRINPRVIRYRRVDVENWLADKLA